MPFDNAGDIVVQTKTKSAYILLLGGRITGNCGGGRATQQLPLILSGPA